MIHNFLRSKQVVLASASPRRKDIFEMIGLKPLIMPADISESIFTNNPRRLVLSHSRRKATQIADKLDKNCFVIAADTIVYHQKEILGKPTNTIEANQFLDRLSDSNHYVYTGISISYKNQIFNDYTKTGVEFSCITKEDQKEYLQTKEPFDKAGAYGIQGFGSQFIRKISGCYFNVMGFPVSLFYEMLKKIEKRNIR